MKTFKERVEEYMQCEKRTLAELLAIKDNAPQTNEPISIWPNIDYGMTACKDWFHCSNPHRDCINCPLLNGYTTTTTTGTFENKKE